jgi:hypothetical protein
MTQRTLYWSRIPGQYLNIDTGVVDNSRPAELVVIRDWYNSLAQLIIDNTTSNQSVMLFSRDIQTLLEHTDDYRPYFKDLDSKPSYIPEENNAELYGFLMGASIRKEGWVIRDQADHIIKVINPNDLTNSVEIVIKGFNFI